MYYLPTSPLRPHNQAGDGHGGQLYLYFFQQLHGSCSTNCQSQLSITFHLRCSRPGKSWPFPRPKLAAARHWQRFSLICTVTQYSKPIFRGEGTIIFALRYPPTLDQPAAPASVTFSLSLSLSQCYLIKSVSFQFY